MTQSPCLPELPKLPEIVSRFEIGITSQGKRFDYTADDMEAYATTHGIACYEAGSAAAAQAAWQPIATAPQRGEFLVYLPGERAKVQHARFRGQLKVIGSNFAFDMTEPTHWMPLPAAPTQGAEGAAPQALRCLTCSDQGAVGLADRSEPCPDCTPPGSMAQAPAPQAVVGEASGVAVRSRALADEVLLALESYSDGGTDKEQLAEDWSSGLLPKVYDTLNLFAALTPSPTPTAPQEADALREDTRLLDWLESNDCTNIFKIGNRWYSRAGYNAPHHRAKSLRDAIRAALAQHQPQQGEQRG